MKKTINFFALFYLLTGFSGNVAGQFSSQQELLSQTSETAGLMINYKQDIDAIKRYYSPYRADNDFQNDEAAQHSPEQMKRLIEINQTYLDQVNKKDFKGISIQGKVDAILLKQLIETALRSVLAEEKEYKLISGYIPFADKIYALEKGRRRGASVDGQQIATLYTTLLTEIDAASNALEKQPPMDMRNMERLKKSIEGLNLRLNSIYSFYYGYDPLFTWWVAEPQKALTARLNQYALATTKKGLVKTTQKADNSGIVEVPIGRDEFIRQLKTEMIDYTPEELLDLANKEFACYYSKGFC